MGRRANESDGPPWTLEVAVCLQVTISVGEGHRACVFHSDTTEMEDAVALVTLSARGTGRANGIVRRKQERVIFRI